MGFEPMKCELGRIVPYRAWRWPLKFIYVLQTRYRPHNTYLDSTVYVSSEYYRFYVRDDWPMAQPE